MKSKRARNTIVIASLITIGAVLAACGGSRFLTLLEFNGLDVSNNNASRVIKPIELAPIPGSSYHHHAITNTNTK